MDNYTRKQNILVASLPAIGLVVIIEALARLGTTFPYPGGFLIAMVAYAAFSGGYPAGILSGALTMIYELIAFSEPGTVLTYSAPNTLRLIVALIFTPLTVLIVCVLRERIMKAAFKFARGEARNEAQKLVEQEHYQFMAVMEQLPFGVIMVNDASCKITFANLEAMKLLGHDVTEFHPYAYHRMFHSSGQPYTPDQWPLIRAVQGGEVVDEEEFFYAGPGGHLRPMWGRAAPIRNAQGQIVAAAMVFHDISANRRAEMAQLELQAIVNTSEDAILSLSMEGTILTWNPAARQIFGYEAENVHGKPFISLLVAEDRHDVTLLIENVRRGNSVGRFETTVLGKDGNKRPAAVRFTPVLDTTGHVRAATAIVRDLSPIVPRQREQDAVLR